MQDEPLVLTVGLIALLVWIPAWVVAVLAARRVYRILSPRRADRGLSTAAAVATAMLLLVAYMPVYLLVIFALLDWGIIPTARS